jgi:DNA mismatch repair protein MutS
MDCATLDCGVSAVGAILAYLERTNRPALQLLSAPRVYQTSAWMPLDGTTLRHLELLQSQRTGQSSGSLLHVLDRTRTPMGARLLRTRLLRPLVDVAPLEQRLDMVAALVEDQALRVSLGSELRAIGDVERQAARVGPFIASHRDLLSLLEALRRVGRIRRLLASGSHGQRLLQAVGHLDPCVEVTTLIERAVAPLQSGQLIRPGFSAELDGLRAGIAETRQWLAGLEQRERLRTGIRSLKVAFNKVFGYYIEVSKSNLHLVPPEYVRKQTIANGERFITPELKERELAILAAEERIEAVEQAAFRDLLQAIDAHRQAVVRTAQAVAELDVALSLAELAVEARYVRPELHEGAEIDIVGGRHPVVEIAQGRDQFIPNDCLLTSDQRLLLITGPNMAGKSTYLRQVALIVLLAQIGSFVPAERARIGLVDRIFTRIGAQDDISAGASTFMVEMAETAKIIRYATPRSLVLLDEVGRGTSTNDGLAIARSVVEYLHDQTSVRTLFATHFQELAVDVERLQYARNFCTAVAEHDGEVLFLHRIVPGAADRSYGIHVARLAGVPRAITERAQAILAEVQQSGMSARPLPAIAEDAATYATVAGDGRQGVWISEEAEAVLRELANVDVLALTPIAALVRLYELQQLARDACNGLRREISDAAPRPHPSLG